MISWVKSILTHVEFWGIFTCRLLAHMSVFISIMLPLQLAGGVILLFVCPLIGTNPLPTWLKWFDNADQYVGRDSSTYMAVRASGWWNNYCWLAWRNPLNYFGYTMMGIQGTSQDQVLTDVPPMPANIGDTSQSGIYHAEVLIDGIVYYEYYMIFKYTLFGTPRCIRIRIGWKLEHPCQTFPTSVPVICEWVFVISPLHSYTGS